RDRFIQVLVRLWNQDKITASRGIETVKGTSLDRIGNRSFSSLKLRTCEESCDPWYGQGSPSGDFSYVVKTHSIAFQCVIVEIDVAIRECVAKRTTVFIFVNVISGRIWCLVLRIVPGAD